MANSDIDEARIEGAANILSVAECAERLRLVAVDEEVGFGNEALELRPVRRLP